VPPCSRPTRTLRAGLASGGARGERASRYPGQESDTRCR
jgi:hypothetical protein